MRLVTLRKPSENCSQKKFNWKGVEVVVESREEYK